MTIDKPSEYFNTVLYTGNGVDGRTITGVGFNPDMSWVKSRSNAKAHIVADSVRGANKNLVPNETGAEFNPTTDVGSGGIGQVTTDGFTCEQGTSDLTNVNQSAYTYASWNWLGGGTAVSNTDGSITSSVSANTTAGFSIVSYTGNSTSGATVGHGLGVVPDVIICKQTGGANDWMSYHSVLGNTKSMRLNATSASATATTYWNDTSPTSTVFSLGSDTKANASDTMIAYCFAEIKGYSKFGSYIGNGATDGTFVYTGFKPAWIVIKRSSSSGTDWYMFDNKRSSFNVVNDYLDTNTSDSELSNLSLDFTSNGFKLRDSSTVVNSSGGTFIYMAFAENPFVTSTGIPATAR